MLSKRSLKEHHIGAVEAQFFHIGQASVEIDKVGEQSPS